MKGALICAVLVVLIDCIQRLLVAENIWAVIFNSVLVLGWLWIGVRTVQLKIIE